MKRGVIGVDCLHDEDIATFVRQTTLRSNISGTQSGGPSPGGKRCCAPVPHGYWKITAFVGGLRLAGMTTPMTLDGAMNDTAFVAVAVPRPGNETPGWAYSGGQG